jgi:hypothetical protein
VAVMTHTHLQQHTGHRCTGTWQAVIWCTCFSCSSLCCAPRHIPTLSRSEPLHHHGLQDQAASVAALLSLTAAVLLAGA